MLSAAAGLLIFSVVMQPPTDTSAAKAAILAAEHALIDATRAKGALAFLDALEPGAAVLFPGQPIHSAASARAPFMARYGGTSVYTWEPAHVVVSADANVGCAVGWSSFRFTFADDTVPRMYPGAYETCWRRGVDAVWRIVAHQRADMLAPGAPPVPGAAKLKKSPHSATVSLPGDQRAETQDTDMAFATFAVDSGTGRAFARFAAPDVVNVMFQTYGPVEMEALFVNYPGRLTLLWKPMREYGVASGGLGFNVGHSVLKRLDGGPEFHGKFLTIWRQNADGSWSYIFDLGSPQECRRFEWRLC